MGVSSGGGWRGLGQERDPGTGRGPRPSGRGLKTGAWPTAAPAGNLPAAPPRPFPPAGQLLGGAGRAGAVTWAARRTPPRAQSSAESAAGQPAFAPCPPTLPWCPWRRAPALMGTDPGTMQPSAPRRRGSPQASSASAPTRVSAAPARAVVVADGAGVTHRGVPGDGVTLVACPTLGRPAPLYGVPGERHTSLPLAPARQRFLSWAWTGGAELRGAVG